VGRTQTNHLLDAALEYAELGQPVFPLWPIKGKKCTCGRPKCSAVGKHPRVSQYKATTDEAQIRRWWKRWPTAGIGGVTGEYALLDIDPKADGMDSLAKLVSEEGDLPSTAVAQTGQYGEERGLHYWFRMPEDVQRSTKIGVRDGIDLLCSVPRFGVLPPSPHKSGVDYDWLTSFDEAVEIPDHLLELTEEYVAPSDSFDVRPGERSRPSGAVRDFLNRDHDPEGSQREFLTRVSRHMLGNGDSVEEVAQTIWTIVDETWENRDPDDPWTEGEITYIVEDLFRKGPTSSMAKDFHTPDDFGNAHRLLDSYDEGHVLFVEAWGKWYVWDTVQARFVEDQGTILQRRWEKITWDEVRKIDKDPKASAEDKRKAIRHWHTQRNRSKIDAAVYLARGVRPPTRPNELNADPWLLNCKNGILDLRTGELEPADPRALLTKRTRAEFNPDAKGKLWQRFLNEVVPDKKLQRFLQVAFGYTLTGLTDEHKFFYVHGPPGTGKTTFLEIFHHALGNYAEAADPKSFMLERGGYAGSASGPSEDIARLSNARLVATHEVEASQQFAEAKISHLTGGESVTARFLHQQTFDFVPQFKVWFTANHKPKVSGSSRSGIWRRIMVIPFEQQIPASELDPTLPARLKDQEEMASVLMWALDGLKEWREKNAEGNMMEVPSLVAEEIKEYKDESDHVALFISEHVKVLEPAKGVKLAPKKHRVPQSVLYDIYLGWCSSQKIRYPKGRQAFNRDLDDRGIERRSAASDYGDVATCWMWLDVVGVPKVRA
jgi:putative DNA primase/helicase